MKVNPSEKSGEMEELVAKHISAEAVVFSDNAKAYVNIHKVVKAHMIETSNTSIETQLLKWVHIAISNIKRNLLGIYHSVNEGFLQLYLNEFCYKLNRRYFGGRLFDRSILAITDLGL